MLEPHDKHWYQIPVSELKLNLQADLSEGISEKRAGELQKRYGKNKLTVSKSDGFIVRLLKQFTNPLVVILLLAGLATIVLKEFLDATVIFLALFINVMIGTFQEERASKAFEKLAGSQERFAVVIREGKKKRIKAEDLVLSDLVILEAGMYVPADIRLVEERNLEVNESALTGEWVDVAKSTEAIDSEVPLAEQSNMAWMGTLIATGSAKGVVIGTGMNTEFGSIAEELTAKNTVVTPIQKNIKRIARLLVYMILAIVMVIFVLGLVKDFELVEILLISIAVAVSLVPEGLPAAVTVVLAIGMEKILSRGGLVRNLLAAETLGSTTVILTDKTGTLTQAKMVLRDIFTLDSLQKRSSLDDSHKSVLSMATFTSDAFLEDEEKRIIRGRPIEKAILERALDDGIDVKSLSEKNSQIDYLPFTSERRYSVSVNKYADGSYDRLYFSGAPELLLERSAAVYSSTGQTMLNEDIQKLFEHTQDEASEKGARMTAIAYKDIPRGSLETLSPKEVEEKYAHNLVFGGLFSYEDPLREEVPASIGTAKSAGTRIIMITGDNPKTARAIATEAGIATSDAPVLSGSEMDELSDDQLLEQLSNVNVLARVRPKQKLRVANLLREQGEIVAMTGDGINDAPALRNADIGVAVGSGTEVAKEASDLVLIDNSFSIIVAAIEEGRRIIDNLKKIVTHLLATSFGEVFLIVGALLFGAPLPILSAQILWINMVEEGLLNFAFAFEPPAKGIMKRKPEKSKRDNLLTPSVKKLIFISGTVTGVFVLALFLTLLSLGYPLGEVRTVMFIAVALDAILFTFSLKDFYKPIYRISLLNNKFLLLSTFISTLALFAAVLIPGLRDFLKLEVLHVGYIPILAGVAFFDIATIEILKYFLFERKRKQA